MLTTKERVTMAWLSVRETVLQNATAICPGAVIMKLHLMSISGSVGKQGPRDAGEIIAELQAAGALVAVAADLLGAACHAAREVH